MNQKWNSGEFLPILTEIARLMKPSVYVELGVGNGHTFKTIAPLAHKAIAVDKRINGIPQLIKKNKLANAHFYNLLTDEFAILWPKIGKGIDLIFIDADHSREQLLRDFENFLPFITAETGIVALHDTLPRIEQLLDPAYCSNAWEAVEEIKRNAKYADCEFLTIPGQWVGLSLIRKTKGQLFWREDVAGAKN